MYDYMKALCYRFHKTTEKIARMEQKANGMQRELSARLNKAEKKLLLRLIDQEDLLREEACLSSFLSGYRVADGIHQELLFDRTKYNYETEEEQLACELMRSERRCGAVTNGPVCAE